MVDENKVRDQVVGLSEPEWRVQFHRAVTCTLPEFWASKAIKDKPMTSDDNTRISSHQLIFSIHTVEHHHFFTQYLR